MHSHAVNLFVGVAWVTPLQNAVEAVARTPEFRLCLIALACAMTATASLLVCAVWAGRYQRGERQLCHSAAHTNVARLESLIQQLVHCSKLARRDGIASLSHPFRGAADPEVAYAMRLVAAHVDARIVRGVPIDRLVEQHTVSGSAMAKPTRRRQCFICGCLILLVANAAGVWQLAPGEFANSPILTAGTFLGWCLGAAAWLISVRCHRTCSQSSERWSLLSMRCALILTAAEMISEHADPSLVEAVLRSQACGNGTPMSLSAAA